MKLFINIGKGVKGGRGEGRQEGGNVQKRVVRFKARKSLSLRRRLSKAVLLFRLDRSAKKLISSFKLTSR